MGWGAAGVGGGWPLRILTQEAENGCCYSAQCFLLVLATILDSSSWKGITTFRVGLLLVVSP